MNNRVYTPLERQEAVALSLTIGQRKAAHQLGLPQRTLSDWVRGTRHPELQAVVIASNAEVAERLWQVIDTGTSELLSRITDPKSRLGDVARALEVAIEARQLLTGGATSNNHNVNVNVDGDGDYPPGLTWQEEADLANWLDAQIAEARDPGEIAAQLRSGVRELEGAAVDLRADVKAEVHDAVADLDEAERVSLRDLIRDMARERLGDGS